MPERRVLWGRGDKYGVKSSEVKPTDFGDRLVKGMTKRELLELYYFLKFCGFLCFKCRDFCYYFWLLDFCFLL